MEIQIWPLAASQTVLGAKPVTAVYGPCLGGFIQNPAAARDQGLAIVENLYVDLTKPATPFVSATCFMLTPGQTYQLPVNFGGDASVAAASAHHRFSGVVFQPKTEVERSQPYQQGIFFPPLGPVTVQNVIPSYLYQQYSDDDDLQAFVDAYNSMAQDYTLWGSNINLAVYTSNNIAGSLLDWIAEGLYGIKRGALSVGHGKTVGPFNTYMLNTLALNTMHNLPAADYFMMNDDIFKRVMTWHIYKGDDKVFNVRWLKRRIMRFLLGENGLSPPGPADVWEPESTYPVSVTWGTGNQVNINLQPNRRRFISGALFNTFMMNTAAFNAYDSALQQFPVSPLAPIFKAAVDAGVLELPFQFKFVVNVA